MKIAVETDDLNLNFTYPASDTDAKQLSKTENKSLSSERGNHSLIFIFN